MRSSGVNVFLITDTKEVEDDDDDDDELAPIAPLSAVPVSALMASYRQFFKQMVAVNGVMSLASNMPLISRKWERRGI